MATTEAAPRLPARTIAAFSAGALSMGALGTPLLVYLPNHYAGELGLSLLAVGAIFALVKLADIALDPILGLLIDRTRTPIGR